MKKEIRRAKARHRNSSGDCCRDDAGLSASACDFDDSHKMPPEKKRQKCKDSPTSSSSSARDTLLQELVLNGGDPSTDQFQEILKPFIDQFSKKHVDIRKQPNEKNRTYYDMMEEGKWLMLSKPNFYGNIGVNSNGDPLYTLGRMSFGMFSPTGLVCSLQRNINQMEVLNNNERQVILDSGLVPKALRSEVENRDTPFRTYNVICFFTIETEKEVTAGVEQTGTAQHTTMYRNNSSLNKDVRRPIHGVMHTYGFTIPDPNVLNRHSIWFTGGKIEPTSSETDVQEWNRFFTLHPPKHTFWEQLKLLPFKLWLGVNVPSKVNDDDHGSLIYNFTNPLGGHGVAYIDVQYLDDIFRIVQGHRGTTLIFSRIEKENL